MLRKSFQLGCRITLTEVNSAHGLSADLFADDLQCFRQVGSSWCERPEPSDEVPPQLITAGQTLSKLMRLWKPPTRCAWAAEDRRSRSLQTRAEFKHEMLPVRDKMKTDRTATKPVRLIRWWRSLGANFCRRGTDSSSYQSSNTVEIFPALSEVSCMAQCQTPGSEKQICVLIQQSTAVSPGLTVLFTVELKMRVYCHIHWNMSSKCHNKSSKLQPVWTSTQVWDLKSEGNSAAAAADYGYWFPVTEEKDLKGWRRMEPPFVAYLAARANVT